MASEDGEAKHLKHDEIVARCAIQPKYITNSIFSSNALLSPTRVDPKSVKKSRWGISVASKLILNSTPQVHGYGCRTAVVQNNEFEKRKNRPPTVDERSFYRGFYDLEVEKVLLASIEGYQVEVISVPENGEDAHCEIRLNPDVSFSKDELSDARTDLISNLAALLCGPERHLCEEDVCRVAQLENAPIPDLPSSRPSAASDTDATLAEQSTGSTS